jgi:hypothetical protein
VKVVIKLRNLYLAQLEESFVGIKGVLYFRLQFESEARLWHVVNEDITRKELLELEIRVVVYVSLDFH